MTSPKGGKRWPPSSGFWLGMAAVLLIAVVLAGAGAIAAGRQPRPFSGRDAPPGSAPALAQAAVAPPDITSAPDFTGGRTTAAEGAAGLAADQQAGDAGPSPAATLPSASSSTVQSPAAVASSWSVSPVFAPPAPAPPVEPGAAQLAREAEQRFGIRIVLDAQDWGPDGASQERNIGAVISAMELLPARVTSSVVANPYGPLTFLSNSQGRTVDGWQPYGDTARSFYTNSDEGPNGRRATNEIVLVPGSPAMTVAHEVLHAYQFRDVGPGEYVAALLSDEMRSFMAATGWRQTVSDGEALAAAHEPWETIDGLYAYERRPLTYTEESGASAVLSPANPLEAFAMAGAMYYAGPADTALPDWPEYWAWFDQNLR